MTRPLAGRARPYEVTDAGTAVPAPFHDPSFRWPSGGFLSTAEDLARFGSAYVDGRLLRPATERRFLREGHTRSGEATGYALGWEVHASPWGAVAGHLGNSVGGSAALLVHPASGIALALTTNLGFVTAPSPPPISRSTPEPPQLLAPFLGQNRP